jgi:hypothetical protein
MAMYVLNAERKGWASSFRRDVMRVFKIVGWVVFIVQCFCIGFYSASVFIHDDYKKRSYSGISLLISATYAWWVWVALKAVS